MTHDEAKVFLGELWGKVMPEGDIDRLHEFYTPDVIGHQAGETFNLNDIVKRFELLRENLTSFHFKLENFILIDNLIIVHVQQNWANQKGEIYQATMSGAYRIRDNKICEIWILANQKLENYRKVNENFSTGMKIFSVSQREKKDFMEHLSLAYIQHTDQTAFFNNTEQECLYYYLKGFSAKEAAKALNLSFRTVETYLANIKNRLGCHTRLELRNKLFPQEPFS